ncbi:MAG: hypothetical protein RR385_07550, partial [Clostridiales bacterium]
MPLPMWIETVIPPPKATQGIQAIKAIQVIRDTGNKGNTGDTGNQGNTGDNGGNSGGTDTPKPDNSPKTINGSVVDATMNNTVIKTDDGTELAFTTSDAEHHYTNGIQVGNAVSITYTGTINGTDTSGVTVISVT